MTGGEKVRSVVSGVAYGMLEQKISAGRSVVLDGGVTTELYARDAYPKEAQRPQGSAR